MDIQKENIESRGHQGKVHEDSASRLAVRDRFDRDSREWRKTGAWKGAPEGEVTLGKDPESSVCVHVNSGRKRRV